MVPIDKGNVGQRDTRIADMDVLITQQHFSADPKALRRIRIFKDQHQFERNPQV
jgi:hypothetical protein